MLLKDIMAWVTAEKNKSKVLLVTLWFSTKFLLPTVVLSTPDQWVAVAVAAPSLISVTASTIPTGAPTAACPG